MTINTEQAMTTRDERIEKAKNDIWSLAQNPMVPWHSGIHRILAKHNFVLMDSKPGEAEVEAAIDEWLGYNTWRGTYEDDDLRKSMRAALRAARKAGG